MGSTVGVLFKVYPLEGQAESVAKRITEQMKANKVSIEEIGFGIKIVKPFFVFEDTQNSSAKIEEQLKKVEGVSEVEVLEESLI
jgi:translation elongation factor EF-1beta